MRVTLAALAACLAFPALAQPAALPDTTEGIHLGLVFNYKIKDFESEKGKIDIVWGAEKPSPPGVYNMAYYPFDRDRDGGIGGASHDYAWFRQNHPEWISYACDKTTPAWEFNKDNPERYVPLDISNPAVLQYMLDQYLGPYLQKGYNAVAFDNVSFANTFKRCGIWRGGQWVRQFSGEERNDPAYVQSVLQWAEWLHPRVRALGGAVAVNFSYDFRARNFAGDATRLLQDVDIVLDEGGSVDIGGGTGTKSEADWLTNTKFENDLDRIGKALIVVNYIRTPHYTYNNMDVHAALNWSVANYLLIKGKHSFLAVGESKDVGSQVDHPELHLPVGHPLSTVYKTGEIYARDYSNAKVFVNPSTASVAKADLGGGKWCDADGRPLSQLAVAPQAGEIVLKCRN